MTTRPSHEPPSIRTALIVVGAGALAGSALVWAGGRYRPQLEDWVLADPAGRVPIVIGLLILLSSGPLLVFALFLWRHAAAAARGLLIRVLAVALGVAAVALAAMLWRLMAVLRPPA